MAQGKPGPLYGVFGQEEFLIQQMLRDFTDCPAFAVNPMLNQERFLAGETPPSKILDSANTLPFLGTRRLIIVQDLDTYKAEALNQLVPYFDNPAPSTCLLFSAARLDARSRFAKALQARGKVHNVRKPYAGELPAWLQERARTRGKKLAPAAARLFVEMGEMGLMDLDREIEKLCLYIGQDTEITAAAAAFVLGQGRLYSIFDLTNAVIEADLGRALSALNQLLAMNESPLAILAMIIRVLRQLSQARQLLDEGGDESRVQQVMRTPPQVTRALLKRARRHSAGQLAEFLTDLLNADVALKSAAMADKTIMENLLFKLCNPPSLAK